MSDERDHFAAVEMWLAHTNAPRHVLAAMAALQEPQTGAVLLREVRDWFDNFVRKGVGSEGWIPQPMNNALCTDYDARYPDPTINSPEVDSSLRVGARPDGGA